MTQPTYLFWQINPLAGIVDTDTIGWVPLRRRKTSGKIKKADIRVRHLPQHLQGDFSKIFTPELIRYADSLPPWQNIDSVAEMAEIWDPLFPDYPLAEGRRGGRVRLADPKGEGRRRRVWFAGGSAGTAEGLCNAEGDLRESASGRWNRMYLDWQPNTRFRIRNSRTRTTRSSAQSSPAVGLNPPYIFIFCGQRSSTR
jgi:hypothetical protein